MRTIQRLVGGEVIDVEVPDIAPPTAEEIEAEFAERKQAAIDGVQTQLIDATAKSHGYDSVDSSVKYQGGVNQLWNDESIALVAWNIQIWLKCFEILGEVEAGSIPEPTIDELIAQMPEIVWPS